MSKKNKEKNKTKQKPHNPEEFAYSAAGVHGGRDITTKKVFFIVVRPLRRGGGKGPDH